MGEVKFMRSMHVKSEKSHEMRDDGKYLLRITLALELAYYENRKTTCSWAHRPKNEQQPS